MLLKENEKSDWELTRQCVTLSGLEVNVFFFLFHIHKTKNLWQ